MRNFACLLFLAATAACSTGNIDVPSLETQPSELLDPRLPVEAANVAPVPVGAELRRTLDAYQAQAEDAARVFDIFTAGIVSEIEAAGAPGSESWIAAIEQLSRLDAARAPVSNALADVDALATRAIAQEGWVNPSERDAIAETAARIAMIDDRLADKIDRLTGRLNP